MTRLTYRGIAHDGSNEMREPGPATMIYRGVRHARMTAGAGHAGPRADMQYRGIVYRRGAAGRRLRFSRQALPVDQLALG